MPFFLKASAKAAVFLTTTSDGIGSRLPSDDAFLEIYDHQRRF
jgi:hypothetical protein